MNRFEIVRLDLATVKRHMKSAGLLIIGALVLAACSENGWLARDA